MSSIYISMLIAIASSGIAGIVTFFFNTYKKSSKTKKMYVESSAKTLVISIIVAILGAVASIVSYFTVLSPSTTKPEDLSTRIETVSSQLKNSAAELSRIQLELEQRITLVDQLKAEAENAEAMISMSEEQVNAIRVALGDEINRNETRNFWISFFQNVFFLALGSIITFLTPKIVSRLKS